MNERLERLLEDMPYSKAVRRFTIEEQLIKISDSACHLFPEQGGPYPIYCGPKAGWCTMDYVPRRNHRGETIKHEWEFNWLDKPLRLEKMLKEAGL
jgi:hypothetical protein